MEWVDDLLGKARLRAASRVASLRARYPDEDDVALGRRLVRSAAFRAGLVGAATGTVALIALPIGMPAGIAASLYLEAELILALLSLYGIDTSGDEGRLKLYALWAGAGFADAAKSAGLRVSAQAIGRVLRGSLPARIIKRLNPILLRAILKRLGLGWLPRAARLWPVLGAPFAFALDRAALGKLGEATLATLDDAARAQRRVRSPARPASRNRYKKIRVAT